MELTVNGIAQRLPAELSVAELVERITDAHRGVAVAVNGEVVPRGGWPGRQLRDGDRVEVLTAAQGG
ncbi:sulfur carrier protein ThiS [Plantactinospora sp. WMMC1484]|uniref:sulfur carrier protein ThiS n=1 Tax=Plantactinospora sp. WMMC1484 TaxID=3404122 RepID=UPI003BF5D88A